jgi:hypothetical protein
MKRTTVMFFLLGAMLLATPVSHASEEFYGTIESRPSGRVGTWVIGGRNVEVTERTRLEEDHGPLVVGACVEVEYEGRTVAEITSEEKNKCGK